MKRIIPPIMAVLTGIARADEPKWDQLVKQSNEYTSNCQKHLEEQFHFSDYDRWDIDQEKGELVFSKNGNPIRIAQFQFVGSYSDTSKTWLWSWANTSILPRLSKGISAVKDYGERNGFKKLTERKWPATQEDGWQMTAISNFLLKGKGVYRPPFAQGATFVVITDIKKIGPK